MDLTALPGYVPGFHTTLALRDLGGQRASDGRTVRHGLIYRGSSLVDLTPQETARLEDLGLSLVLDLRAAGEAEGLDDYVPHGANYLRIAGMYDANGDEVDFSPAGITRIAALIEEQQERFMTDLYVGMAHDNPAVHALVEHMAQGGGPIYFHCSAGKDRTGVCAAMALTLLGVDDDAIVQEFLLTNEYRAEIINNMPVDLPEHARGYTKEQWAEVNSVQEYNLRAVFDEIDANYPTREAYFAKEFGLDANAVARIRDRYLA